MKTTKLIALLLSALCLLPLSACDTEDGATNDQDGASATTTAGKDEASKGPIAVDLTALKAQIFADLSVTDAVDVETDMLLDLYGIAAADVAESVGYMTMDGVFPDEVILVKAVDADAAQRIADALTRRLEEVKLQSKDYDPENYELAQSCSVQTTDLYVTLFLSPHHERMTELFNDAAN